MESPTSIIETPQWLAGPQDELRHTFRAGAVPLVVSCRFLSFHTGGFQTPRSFVHPTPIISRIFLFLSGSALCASTAGAAGALAASG